MEKISNNNKKALENDVIIKKYKINEKWLSNSGLLCRYNSFVTFFYFLIYTFLFNNNNKYNNTKLKELFEMIITLSNDANFSNLKKIIYFFQINNYDSNNAILDFIKKEND